MQVRRVVLLAVPPIRIPDLTAPFEVFARSGGYRVELASSNDTGLVTSSSGLTLAGAQSYRNLRGPIDTPMLPGGDGAEEIICDTGFLSWLRRTSRRVRVSVPFVRAHFSASATAPSTQQISTVHQDGPDDCYNSVTIWGPLTTIPTGVYYHGNRWHMSSATKKSS